MMADATCDKQAFDHVAVWKLMYFVLMIEESIIARDKLEAQGVRVLSVKEKQRGD